MNYPYTVIGHLEAGEEYCRGCLMAAWGCEFEWGQFETLESAINYGKTIVEKSERHPKSGYEIILLNAHGTEQYWPNANSEEPFSVALHLHSTEIRDKIRIEKEQAERDRLQKIEDDRKRMDLAELARLKAQYGEQ
ncbi:hypothetical protein PMW_157 [Pseudomonas phage phiPMW]|uniref:Uncharacterized protein n=1 Tax=Pseudomonas phage phiPMW TaxID=1815582 RepID=A0A1S5R1I1_9CAUD|nr:hypothetical protein FDG97_gp193 [Pseudomonas phage phiPMW]ANA49282.1 hypothetical protein PMW_157 [Pseudomonas phage phiPMW]